MPGTGGDDRCRTTSPPSRPNPFPGEGHASDRARRLHVDSLLALDVADIGYNRGHHTLRVTVKGGRTKEKPLPPFAYHALLQHLDGRTAGPLFTTRTGHRLAEPEVWKCLRRLARRAGLPQADTIHPHVLRHNGITDALEAGAKLEDVQDAADHRTTQRYNRRRNRLG